MLILRRLLPSCALPAALAAALLLSASTAHAHGNLDQALDGDPGCNTSNFPASVTAAGGQRQSFVPTGAALSSIGLCLSASSPGTDLVIGVRTAGGTLIGGGSSLGNITVPDSAGPAVRYVHVDFASPLPVTPGASHIIEIQSGATLTWYGTSAGSPYDYCHGAPNNSAVQDFAFHAYTADAPAGSAACPAPPATNTPVPPPTNTPLPPTSTSVPGTTPTATPSLAPGQTPPATATQPVGVAPQPGQPSAPAASGGARASTSRPGTLPASGFGDGPAADRTTLILLTASLALGVGGAAFVRRGVGR